MPIITISPLLCVLVAAPTSLTLVGLGEVKDSPMLGGHLLLSPCVVQHNRKQHTTGAVALAVYRSCSTD